MSKSELKKVTKNATDLLFTSNLGTKKHWNGIYKKELSNFNCYGTIGDVWYGEDTVARITNWVLKSDLITPESSILDIGCGNGITLIDIGKEGYNNLFGIDYCKDAVELAQRIAQENKFSIKYEYGDVLSLEGEGEMLKRTYDVCHDKGTYDAVSLSPIDPRIKMAIYIKNVHKLVKPEGLFILVSSNWTGDELCCQLKEYFDEVCLIPSPSFMFAGKIGQRESSMVFRSKIL